MSRPADRVTRAEKVLFAVGFVTAAAGVAGGTSRPVTMNPADVAAIAGVATMLLTYLRVGVRFALYVPARAASAPRPAPRPAAPSGQFPRRPAVIAALSLIVFVASLVYVQDAPDGVIGSVATVAVWVSAIVGAAAYTWGLFNAIGPAR